MVVNLLDKLNKSLPKQPHKIKEYFNGVSPLHPLPDKQFLSESNCRKIYKLNFEYFLFFI